MYPTSGSVFWLILKISCIWLRDGREVTPGGVLFDLEELERQFRLKTFPEQLMRDFSYDKVHVLSVDFCSKDITRYKPEN